MKKLWLFLSLIICGISLTWCFKILDWDWMVNEVDEPEIVNKPKSNEIIPWWYLYKNLDLTKEEDKAEYEQLQNDRNMILKYQTDTSAAVNEFIDVIYDDLLKSCEQYWTGYETRKWTMYRKKMYV